MEILFEPVAHTNRTEAEELRVAPGQEHCVESVADCLREADEIPAWRPVRMLDGNQPVGFAMYGYWESEGRLWLDRYLIGHHFQGRGYGRACLSALLEHLELEYGRQPVYLSVYGDNHPAIRLYESFGFCFNEETDINGELVMVRAANMQPE